MSKKTKTVDWADPNQTLFPCGKPPYRFIDARDTASGATAGGLVRSVETNDGLEHLTTPGGSCAVCGTSIKVLYNFRSSDGITFHVGSECAEQANLPTATLRSVRKAKKARAKMLAEQRYQEKMKALRHLIEIHDYSIYPHPHAIVASHGRTMSDYIQFVLRNGGKAAKLRLLKRLIDIENK